MVNFWEESYERIMTERLNNVFENAYPSDRDLHSNFHPFSKNRYAVLSIHAAKIRTDGNWKEARLYVHSNANFTLIELPPDVEYVTEEVLRDCVDRACKYVKLSKMKDCDVQ